MRSDPIPRLRRAQTLTSSTTLLLTLLLFAGCADTGVGPDQSESLAIEVDAVGVHETSLTVGESVQLSAQLRSPSGAVFAFVASWRSDDPTVAEIDDSGRLSGRGIGATRVIATAGMLSDTLFVTVLAGLPGGARCLEGAEDEGVRLELGEALTTTATAAPALCLSGGAEYLIVPFHAAETAAVLQVEIEGMGISGPTVSADVQGADVAPTRRTEPMAMPSPEFDRRLRAREARDLTQLIRASGAPLRPEHALSTTTVPRIGERLTLNVNRDRTCSSPINRAARVVAVSDRAVVLADELNPSGGFTDTEYAAFAESFDELVYPVVRNNFGDPTDIDGNARVLIFFTRAVNEMTESNSATYVGGFFFARDLFPLEDTRELRGCAGSNAAELLYMLAADPSGEVNGNSRSKAFVSERTIAVLAHEMQHLVSAGRRMRLLGRENWSEEFWLNEGLSHIAEELVFYAASGTAPRSEIGYTELRSSPKIEEAFEQFQTTNLVRLSSFMKSPADASSFYGDDLATRGASWSFLRYAADRHGGAESVLWRRLIDGNAIGYANLLSALGASPMSWMHDWAVSLALDDIVPVAANFRTPSWNYRSILRWIDLNAGSYPLRVTSLRPRWGDGVARFELAPGGVGFVRFFVRSTERGTLRTTSGGAAPPPSLRLTVVRIR